MGVASKPLCISSWDILRMFSVVCTMSFPPLLENGSHLLVLRSRQRPVPRRPAQAAVVPQAAGPVHCTPSHPPGQHCVQRGMYSAAGQATAHLRQVAATATTSHLPFKGGPDITMHVQSQHGHAQGWACPSALLVPSSNRHQGKQGRCCVVLSLRGGNLPPIRPRCHTLAHIPEHLLCV